MKKRFQIKSLSTSIVVLFLTAIISCSKSNTSHVQKHLPSVTFTATNSLSESGKVDFQTFGVNFQNADIQWNFGDGSMGTGANTSHTYSSFNQSYSVTLTVTNTDGTDSKTQTVNPGYAEGRAGFYYYGPGFFNNSNEFILVTITGGPTNVNESYKISQSGFALDCSDNGVIRFYLPPGNYNYTATKSIFNTTTSGSCSVSSGNCTLTQITF